MKFTKAAADAKVMEEQASTRRRKLEADERLLQIRAKDLIDAMQHLELREARFTEESAGTVTQRLAAAELALAAAHQKNLGLETQLAEARYRNAEHEKHAQAAGRRDSEDVQLEIRQRTPKR